MVLGEGRMLPELEQGLIGATAGDHRDISVSFPADYRATELAGKTAIFSTDIKTVEEPALPEVDEEFCKSFGVTEGGIPKLREDVAANMRRELEQNLRTRNKTAVLEKLYQANPIDVPNAMLESQIREHADRVHAPGGDEGCVAGAAARAAGGTRAAPRRARPDHQRRHPQGEHCRWIRSARMQRLDEMVGRVRRCSGS